MCQPSVSTMSTADHVRHFAPRSWSTLQTRTSVRIRSSLRRCARWATDEPREHAAADHAEIVRRHSLVLRWKYFVGVTPIKAYREFEDRVGAKNPPATPRRRGASGRII